MFSMTAMTFASRPPSSVHGFSEVNQPARSLVRSLTLNGANASSFEIDIERFVSSMNVTKQVTHMTAMTRSMFLLSNQTDDQTEPKVVET